MLSMFKMEGYRILKNKYFYLSIVLFVVFTGVCIYMQNNEQILMGYQGLPKEQELGFYFTINYHLNSVLHFISSYSLKYSMFIFGIFLVVFVCSEYNSGFIKNSCMMYKNRSVIILNKIMIIIMMSVFISLLSFVCSNIFGHLFVQDFVLGNLMDTISYLAIMTIVNVAYFSLILFLCMATRNKSFVIVVTLLITMGITSAFFETAFGLFKVSELTNYTLSKITMNLPMLYDKTLTIRALLMSGIFIIFYNVLNVLLINKKDI